MMSVLYVDVTVLEEYAASIFRVKDSRIRMRLGSASGYKEGGRCVRGEGKLETGPSQ